MKAIKLKLSTKIALFTFVLSLLGITALAIISYQQSNKIFKKNLVSSLSFEVEKSALNITKKIAEAKKNLLFTSNSESIKGILRTTKNKFNYDEEQNMHLNAWKSRLEKLFIVIMKQNPAYFQMRFIELKHQGKEVIRVEQQNNKIKIVKNNNLQSKGQNSYFTETIKLKKDDIFISKINLNREHNVIVTPYIPTIRVATPIYNGDKVFGIIIININIKDLFDFKKFNKNSNFQTYITNSDGQYILNNHSEKVFGFEFGKDYKIEDDYNIKHIFENNIKTDSFYDENISSALAIYKLKLLDKRLLYIVHIANSDYFEKESQSYIKVLVFYIIGIAVIIAFFIAFVLKYLTAPISKLTNSARLITDGEKIDFDKLAIKTGDEIEELSDSFKFMVTSLSDSQAKLQNLADNLEIEVDKKTKDLQESQKEIQKAHKQTRDSIEYASLIQGALIPRKEVMLPYVNNHFTIWQPKDIVGGDIYFVTELESKEEILIMVIDGAGHGVPGAFVTMLVKAIETQIIAEIKAKTLEPDPALILEYFNKSIKAMLRQEKGSKSNAGFDGGILYYNKNTKECKYAGAKTDLYIINDNKLDIVNGDKKNVGFIRTKIDQKYTLHNISLKENTKLYLSTDGVFDQEGENKSRYGVDRFENFLIEINNYSFEKQSKMIMDSFNNFKKDIKQTDDVTVIGINFK